MVIHRTWGTSTGIQPRNSKWVPYSATRKRDCICLIWHHLTGIFCHKTVQYLTQALAMSWALVGIMPITAQIKQYGELSSLLLSKLRLIQETQWTDLGWMTKMMKFNAIIINLKMDTIAGKKQQTMVAFLTIKSTLKYLAVQTMSRDKSVLS